MRICSIGLITVFAAACASSPPSTQQQQGPLEFGAACVAAAKWISENGDGDAIEQAQELGVTWEELLAVHPAGPEAVQARIEYSYSLTSLAPISAEMLFPKCAQTSTIEQRRLEVQELANSTSDAEGEADNG